MVLKRAKCDWNGVEIAIFAAKLQKPRSSGGLRPLCDTFELQRFVQLGTKFRQFLCKKQLLLVQAPSLLPKPWLRFWSHSLLQAYFSSDYTGCFKSHARFYTVKCVQSGVTFETPCTGRMRNELINAVGRICIFFQRWMQICSFKISGFTCKTSVNFIVPPFSATALSLRLIYRRHCW